MDQCVVDSYFHRYRECAARCAFLEASIHELERKIEYLRNHVIDETVSISPVISDMPHSSTLSDPTATIGIKVADGYVTSDIKEMEHEVRMMKMEMDDNAAVVIFVDAWMKVLTIKERFVIEKKTLGGMSWRELINAYGKEFGDILSRQGMRNIRESAMRRIYAVAS